MKRAYREPQQPEPAHSHMRPSDQPPAIAGPLTEDGKRESMNSHMHCTGPREAGLELVNRVMLAKSKPAEARTHCSHTTLPSEEKSSTSLRPSSHRIASVFKANKPTIKNVWNDELIFCCNPTPLCATSRSRAPEGGVTGSSEFC